jgi:RNA polymerase sigma-70 factor, ECF subfamily
MLGEGNGGCQRCIDRQGVGDPGRHVESGTGLSASLTADRGPEALVAAARRGDGEAFMLLLDGHDRMLRSLAFRILGDRDQMDDVLQDVALKAFMALPKFRGDASVATWLYRITYTTCLNRLRRAGPTAPPPDCEDDGPSPLSSGLSSADTADDVIRHIELAAALASLTAEQRAVVALVLEEGLDHHTAAEILGIPTGTVASRLAAARTALRRFLSESLPTGEGQ